MNKLPKSQYGRPPIYPWEEWMNGHYWELVPGEDFYSDPISFRVHCHKMARQHGLKVSTKFKDGNIFIYFYKPSESDTE